MQLALTGTHSVIILLKGMEGKCLSGLDGWRMRRNMRCTSVGVGRIERND